jgi:aldehyde:ferredoxin oxidoreductase
MSARFGPESEPFNITVRGQELPMHEPRLKVALGVGYAVAPVGADHMMNIHDTAYASDGRAVRRVNAAMETPLQPVPKDLLNEDKMQIFYHEVNWMHLHDCALICQFYCYDYDHVAEALSGVTGEEYGIHDMLAVGARAQTLSRLFNLREGFTAADDKLPKRVMTAFESGPLEGVEITEEAFAWSKARYYELMQWDPETGVPTEACLQGLELEQFLG